MFIRKTFLFLCLLYFAAIAQQNTRKVHAVKTAGPITIDGELNEQVWQTKYYNDLIQKEPDEGKPATEKTKVWVAYDDEYIYVAAQLDDSSPDSVDVTISRKDTFIPTDMFFVGFDPYHDKRTGYFFGLSAGGTMLDGTFYNETSIDDSWDGVWEAKSKLNKNGWSLEMKIPFSQLRFNKADSMVWGIDFMRFIKRKNEEDHFIRLSRKESKFISLFAELHGLNGIEPKQRIEALPYIVQKVQFLIHDENDPFYKSNQFVTTLGADFKVGIGANLNLDLTINPDFGQVEVDPAVVNLTAFETFYNEKRPFFIEGQNIFNFARGGASNNWNFNFGNPTLFYSRRIGRSPQGYLPSYDYADFPKETRILGAAKLSGKIGNDLSVGALSAVTQRMFASYYREGKKYETEVEPLTHYGVLRSQKEFDGGKHALGFMLTSVNRDLSTPELRNILSKQAYTFGLDGWTFLDDERAYVLTGYAVGSYVQGSEEYLIRLQQEPYRYFQRPDATYMQLDSNRTSLSGFYTRFTLNKQQGNFYFNASLGAVSPGFENNDLGFQFNADKINAHLVLGYRWFEPDGFFRKKFLYAAHFKSYDFEGNLINNGAFVFGNLQFMNYYNINLNVGYNAESFSKTLTRGGPLAKIPAGFWSGLFISSDSRENLIVSIGGNVSGDRLGGNSVSINAEVLWKPTPQINLSIEPEYSNRNSKLQYVTTATDDYATATFGKRYIFGELNQKTVSANIRLNWTFTPTISLQLFAQPLISVGNYTNFKEYAEPGTLEFNVYGKGNSTIAYDENNDEYIIDPDGNGPTKSFNLYNPNFNFKSIRGTLVFRWEVMPGSIFYLVWSHDRTNFNNPGDFDLSRDFNNLLNSEANNIFLAKFTYWLDI